MLTPRVEHKVTSLCLIDAQAAIPPWPPPLGPSHSNALRLSHFPLTREWTPNESSKTHFLVQLQALLQGKLVQALATLLKVRSHCRNGRVGAPGPLCPLWLPKSLMIWRFWRKILMPKWALVVAVANFRFGISINYPFSCFKVKFYINMVIGD